MGHRQAGGRLTDVGHRLGVSVIRSQRQEEWSQVGNVCGLDSAVVQAGWRGGGCLVFVWIHRGHRVALSGSVLVKSLVAGRRTWPAWVPGRSCHASLAGSAALREQLSAASLSPGPLPAPAEEVGHRTSIRDTRNLAAAWFC